MIQCIGNRLRGDDGAGPAVADRLRDLGLGDHVREYWGEGTELMQDWEGRERVIVVDASRSGAPPGTLHILDANAGELPRDLRLASSHRLGLAEVIELARMLDLLPKDLKVHAIEGEGYAPGEGLSLFVERAALQLADQLRGEAMRHGAQNASAARD
nr:hydrogenase maturation protease [Thiorhodococcus minor]